MNPPKCKVCGWEHWSGAPHYSGSTAIAASVIPVVPRLPRIPVSDKPPVPQADPKRPRGRPISPAPKSPRAEYQRELMRKRRAAEKEAKP